MKRTLLLPLLLASSFAQAQLIWSDDFESYADGAFIAENSGGSWTTWSGTPGSSEDAVATINQQHSGSKSAFVDGPSGQGDVDLVHLFDITSGRYEFVLWINVAEGAGGYFNLLHSFNGNDSEWAVDVQFLPDQTGFVLLDNTEHAFNYTSFNWVEFRADIDIDNDLATYWVNGTQVASEPWSMMSSGGAAATSDLDALDIFAYSGGGGEPATFYIDDVSLTEINVSVPESGLSGLMIGPNPVRDELLVTFDHPVGARTTIEVFDGTGHALQVPATINGDRVQLDMSTQASGVYTLRVTDNAQTRIEKVVKD